MVLEEKTKTEERVEKDIDRNKRGKNEKIVNK